MYHKPAPAKSTDMSDDEPDIDIEKLLKDVELFGNYLIYCILGRCELFCSAYFSVV